MRLPRILNQCHPIPGFVYGQASFAEDEQAVLQSDRSGEPLNLGEPYAATSALLSILTDTSRDTPGSCMVTP